MKKRKPAIRKAKKKTEQTSSNHDNPGPGKAYRVFCEASVGSNRDNPGKIYVPGLKPEDFLEDHELAEMSESSPPSRFFPELQSMGNDFLFPNLIAESLHNYALDAALLFQLDKTVYPAEFSKHVETMDRDSNIQWFSRLYQHCLQIMRDGFVVAILRYQKELRENPEAAAFLDRLGPGGLDRASKALRRLTEQEEHLEIFQAKGQAVKAENDKGRSARVCKLYNSVRQSYSEGRKGNGDVLRVVTERFEAMGGESITVETVRNNVKKAGLAQSLRRKGKH